MVTLEKSRRYLFNRRIALKYWHLHYDTSVRCTVKPAENFRKSFVGGGVLSCVVHGGSAVIISRIEVVFE